MITPREIHKKIRGRRIALYPGAFRPPHQAHLTAVLDLVSRPDVDEVVVIISKRFRRIPGTTKALDADVARRIWAVYLNDVANVRIEIATHTAVQHALGYLDQVEAGDTLLFCIGETDLAQGDSRFSNLEGLANHTGVSAVLVPAPTGSITVRSTDLRGFLACGAEGCAPFLDALPEKLNEEQRKKVWSICCEGMKEISEILQEKIRDFIVESGLGEIRDINPVRNGKMDPVFRVHLTDGRCYFVKYAGNTVESGCLDQKLSHKPRRRIMAERRAIKRLRMNKLSNKVDLPEVVMFDLSSLTLVLTEVCPGGRTLLKNLKEGIFDPDVASAASRFLAKCHTLPVPINPVWGDNESDQFHWERMLALRTGGDRFGGLSAQIRQDLDALKSLSHQASTKTSGNQLLILDYSPKNILLGEGKIGVIDLELSSTIGDPAYDLGFFLGNYIFWGIITSSGQYAQEAIEEALAAYRDHVGILWVSMRPRVLSYAGATIFYNLTNDSPVHLNGLAPCLSKTAAILLNMGLGQVDEISTTLGRAITCQLI